MGCSSTVDSELGNAHFVAACLMYGKIFSSMYDGSLYGQWEAIVTFQQMIVLADAEGYVDMTPQALAARTSIPLEIIQKGIELLLSPDKYSRTPDCDGRRIELVDDARPWGWRVVNHRKYRQMASAEEKREADRIRIAEKRAAEVKSQPVAGRRNVSQPVADVAHADADTDTEAKKKGARGANPPAGLNSEAWERWRQYRREIRKPIKSASMLAAQRKLAGYGADQAAIVEQSIANGWTGLFALKDKPNGKHTPPVDDGVYT
jgi:hypothetical protein